jgi:hypothetical protein
MPIRQGSRRGAATATGSAPLAKPSAELHPSGGAEREGDAIRISKRVAILALALTLLGGMFLGGLIHWGLSDEPASPQDPAKETPH